jgi:hypothetical protein
MPVASLTTRSGPRLTGRLGLPPHRHYRGQQVPTRSRAHQVQYRMRQRARCQFRWAYAAPLPRVPAGSCSAGRTERSREEPGVNRFVAKLAARAMLRPWSHSIAPTIWPTNPAPAGGPGFRPSPRPRPVVGSVVAGLRQARVRLVGIDSVAVPLYEGLATIVTAEDRSFEIVCTLRSSRERGDSSAFGSPSRVGVVGPAEWGASFMLVDPRQRGALLATTIAEELVTLRLGDGREAIGSLRGGARLSGSGAWPPPPLLPAA